MAISDNGSREQYVVQAGETQFVYPFKIYVEGDIKVVWVDANEVSTTLSLGTDYTVSGVDVDTGGYIELTGTQPVVAGDHIILISKISYANLPASDYKNGSSFDPDLLNDNKDKDTARIRQNKDIVEDRALMYDEDQVIYSTEKEIPVLDHLEVWIGGSSNNITKTKLDENPNCSTLRSDLLHNTLDATSGAKNVGYYDTYDTPAQTTVNAKLKALSHHTENKKDMYPFFAGFQTNMNTDDHNVEISRGSCSAYRSDHVITLDSDYIKDFEANWAEGSGNGGFPSSIVAAVSTTYHIFALSKEDGTFGSGFDIDINAVNLLLDATGYIHYRRICSVLTDGTGKLRRFWNYRDTFYYYTPIVDMNNIVVPTSVANYQVTVPAGHRKQVIFNYNYGKRAPQSINIFYLYFLNQFNQVATVPNVRTWYDINVNIDGFGEYTSLTTVVGDTQIIYMRSSDGVAELILETTGFIDDRSNTLG